MGSEMCIRDSHWHEEEWWPLEGIRCPFCGILKGRKAWTAGQWRRRAAIFNNLNCCKDCDVDRMRPWPQAVQKEMQIHCIQLWSLYRHILRSGWLYDLNEFFNEWCRSPNKWRKAVSHYGALQRGRPTDPEGWAFNPRVCKKIVGRDAWWKFAIIDPLQYFDPGNSHYAECFHALFGATPFCNNETIGDIIESLLGLQFVVSHRRDYPTLGIKANDIDLIKEGNSTIGIRALYSRLVPCGLPPETSYGLEEQLRRPLCQD